MADAIEGRGTDATARQFLAYAGKHAFLRVATSMNRQQVGGAGTGTVIDKQTGGAVADLGPGKDGFRHHDRFSTGWTMENCLSGAAPWLLA